MIRSGRGINETYEVSGDSPLGLAALRGDLGLVRLLLEHGADPWHRNDDDKTADGLASDARIKRAIRTAQAVKGHARDPAGRG